MNFFVKIIMLILNEYLISCSTLEDEMVLSYEIKLMISEKIDKIKKLELFVNNFFNNLPIEDFSKIFKKKINEKTKQTFIQTFPELSGKSTYELFEDGLSNTKIIYVFLIEDLYAFFSLNKKFYYYNGDTLSYCDFRNLLNQIKKNNNLSVIIKKLVLKAIIIFFTKIQNSAKNYKINFKANSFITLKSNPQEMKTLFLFIIFKICSFMKISKFPDEIYNEFFFAFFNRSPDFAEITLKVFGKTMQSVDEHKKTWFFTKHFSNFDIDNIKNIYVSEKNSQIIIMNHIESLFNYRKINEKLFEILKILTLSIKKRKKIKFNIVIDCSAILIQFFKIIEMIIQENNNIIPEDFCVKMLQNFDMDEKLIDELIVNLTNIIKFVNKNILFVDKNNNVNSDSFLTIKINYINEKIFKDNKKIKFIPKGYDSTVRNLIKNNIDFFYDIIGVCFDDFKKRFMLLDVFLNKDKKLEFIKNLSITGKDSIKKKNEIELISMFTQKQKILYNKLQTRLEAIKSAKKKFFSNNSATSGIESRGIEAVNPILMIFFIEDLLKLCMMKNHPVINELKTRCIKFIITTNKVGK
ncbi:hypothetical protein GVAV_001626 [Gurleya vavrai]